jgi:hypothetical protein
MVYTWNCEKNLEVKKMKTQKVLITIILLTYCTIACATFVSPTDAPIDRLIKNTTAYLKDKPNDAKAHYTLARIHYLAFIHNCASVPVFSDKKPPEVAGRFWDQGHMPYTRIRSHAEELALKEIGYGSRNEIPKEKHQQFEALRKRFRKELEDKHWIPNAFTKNELAQHAAKALTNFQQAIELEPKNALYHLGKASLLEQYVEFLRDIHEPNIPEPFRAIIIDKARDSYYSAYEFSIKKDLKTKFKPYPRLNMLVGYEAATAYIRLSQLDTAHSDEDKRRIAKVKKDLNRLENLPDSGIVTPIVFSLKENDCFADLLAPELTVSFDLNGDNIIERNSWVKPSTAILVWDPQKKGHITSGRQLFGSVTWWIFFDNGYHALDALDDNRDGQLSGNELKGLALWHDKNSNGASDFGEVTPIEEYPIASIATKSTTADGISPMNPQGLTLTNNQKLPTYDWTTSPLQ